jgi:hypothetical protein
MNIPVIEHNVQPPGGAGFYTLGKHERPDFWCVRLRTLHYCLVDVDEAGRIQTLRWHSPPGPLRADLLRLFEDPDNFPFLLLSANAEPVWVQSPSSILVGVKGAAVKTNAGEVLWVPAEQIIGAAIRWTDEPGNDNAQPPAVEKTNDVEER